MGHQRGGGAAAPGRPRGLRSCCCGVPGDGQHVGHWWACLFAPPPALPLHTSCIWTEILNIIFFFQQEDRRGTPFPQQLAEKHSDLPKIRITTPPPPSPNPTFTKVVAVHGIPFVKVTVLLVAVTAVVTCRFSCYVLLQSARRVG